LGILKFLGIEVIDDGQDTERIRVKDADITCIVGGVIGIVLLVYGLLIQFIKQGTMVSVNYQWIVFTTWGIIICTCSVLGGLIAQLYNKVESLQESIENANKAQCSQPTESKEEKGE